MSLKTLIASAIVYTVGLATPTVAQAATWSVVASPNPTQNDSLTAVAWVPNTTQFWAVGSAMNAAGVSQPTIVRTTGSGWSVVVSPSLPGGGGGLNDVAALNTTNAWAVGYHRDSPDPRPNDPPCQAELWCGVTGPPLVEHWNGKTWQLMSLPAAGNANLNGVKVFSASDVLAVGTSENGSAVAYHWNGSGWSIWTLPLPASCAGETTSAAAVAAVPSSSTRFAVGTCGPFGSGAIWQLASGKWSAVWTGDEVLNDITPVGAKSIWAVGSKGSSASLVHWNGKTWASTTVPADLSDDIYLEGVIRVPGTQTLWATGGILNDLDIPVAAYYNGSKWSRVDVPGGIWGDLFSVAASSASNVYAVGGNWDVSVPPYQPGEGGCTVPPNPDGNGCPATTLIERYH
jgi:hypothetical protein